MSNSNTTNYITSNSNMTSANYKISESSIINNIMSNTNITEISSMHGPLIIIKKQSYNDLINDYEALKNGSILNNLITQLTTHVLELNTQIKTDKKNIKDLDERIIKLERLLISKNRM
jgi:hypothetical protein